MKRVPGLRVGIGLIGLLGMGQAAWAGDPDQVRQLLQTNACENCDLSGANLRGLNLTGANLQGANLTNASLTRSILLRANLRGANLRGADLTAANLQGANLQQADLSSAQVTSFCGEGGLELSTTECQIFNLTQVLGPELCDPAYGLQPEQRQGTSIDELCLSNIADNSFFYVGSLFSGLAGLMQGMNLMGADLRGANLSNLNLEGADLRYAQLTGANLSGTSLAHALLFEASIDEAQQASLEQAYLTKADVGQLLAPLLQEQAASARLSEGSQYTGAMNRAQQAHYLETDTFATNLADLGLGYEPETGTYEFKVARTTERFAVNVAIAQQEDAKSYLGIVYSIPDNPEGPISAAILCQTDRWPGSLPDIPPAPETASDELTCPVGFDPFEF